MSSSTALLPWKKDDHPIFLRVCHSPWVSISQSTLVVLRGLTAAYLFFSFLVVLDFDIRNNNRGWLIPFEFSNVAYVLLWLYHTIAFSWTFMHLYYPHPSSQTDSCSKNIQTFFSPPRQCATSNNRGWFSMFYTAANTFPHMCTFIHWAVLIPNDKATIPVDEMFGHGWLVKFFVFNKFAIISLIAFLEIFFFSSIKRQAPISGHIFGMACLSLIYIAWAYVGYCITDKFSYWFLDHHLVGWDNVIGSWFLFGILANICFAVMYFIVGIREFFTKKSESKTHGYQPLPQ